MTCWTLPLVAALAALPCAAAQPAKGAQASQVATAWAPDWKSLDARPTPTWFQDAKFGIFIHWGVYSVPAYTHRGGYAEWYYRGWKEQRPKSAVWQFHQKAFGKDFPYEGFAPLFRAELWEPTAWAELFRKAGARYVVLTSKHHDGYCLWPSAQRPGWNAMETGPRRDLVGELSTAVKGAGLRMGLYYSLPEWTHPQYTWVYPRPANDVARYVDQHMIPQIKDLVDRYQPSLLWADGEWDHNDKVWRSTEIVSWLFNHPKLRDEIVVNDRWGSNTRFKHGSFFATEYTEGMKDTDRPWEECRGLGRSFGLNRNERATDYQTAEQLIHMFVNLVSEGGNLLLNIGPNADGTVPALQEERLLEMGQWLGVNGPAIYGTRPWVFHREGERVRFTRSQDGRIVNALTLGWPGATLSLPSVKVRPGTTVRLLGVEEPIQWTYEVATGTTLHLPCHLRDRFKGATELAYAFQMEADSNVVATPRVMLDGATVEGQRLFVDRARIQGACATAGARLVHTLDGSEPTAQSPELGTLALDRDVVLKVRAVHPDLRPSPVVTVALRRGQRVAPVQARGLVQGLETRFAEGSWPRLPDVDTLPGFVRGEVHSLGLESVRRDENYTLSFQGFLQIPTEGVYTFFLASDDGSRLSLGGTRLIDHDGMHNDAETRSGSIVLGKGLHPFRLDYLQGGGGASLRLEVEGPGLSRQLVPDAWLRHARQEKP